MSGYIRLAEPPRWVLKYPECSACSQDLDTDGDGWICSTCGTSWDMDANDGDTGVLYADWSGEEPTGPAVPTEDARHWGYFNERTRLHEAFPNLIPQPTRPAVGAPERTPRSCRECDADSEGGQ